MNGVKLTKTLLLTISLPEFYVEDITQDHADEYWSGDMSEAALETMDLITRTVRVLIARGDRGGNDLIDQHAVILSASVVDREPQHDGPEDERLTEMTKHPARRTAMTADAYDPTSYHPDDVAAGNTPTDAELAADRDAPAFVQYVPEAAGPQDIRALLHDLWDKLDAESGYVR